MTTSSIKLQTNYDITLVFRSDLDKLEIKETIQKFIQNFKFWNGECEKVIHLGKKLLAYPIKKESRGSFVLLKISVSPAAINRFQETICQTEEIIRYQIIKY